jgi:hypothetical protein
MMNQVLSPINSLVPVNNQELYFTIAFGYDHIVSSLRKRQAFYKDEDTLKVEA